VTAQAAGPPVVLIHGLWLSPSSWDGWKERFETQGHEVLAPPWPGMDRSVEEIRRDPSPLNGLGVREIADHYAAIIGAMERAPVIIGHSFGGLVTELLLDRGLGLAGVALSPGPFKGILRVPVSQIRASAPALLNPANRKRTVKLTPEQFRYAFTNTMSAEESREIYDRYHIPGPGRPLFQAAFANFNPHAATKVDVHNDSRPPLLIVGNGADHTVPASVSREAATRLGRSRSKVDYQELPGRPHLTAGAPGWEAVADMALEWSLANASATVPTAS
jgi:pimeloyl-ACP methyl ester carboxylesterase